MVQMAINELKNKVGYSPEMLQGFIAENSESVAKGFTKALSDPKIAEQIAAGLVKGGSTGFINGIEGRGDVVGIAGGNEAANLVNRVSERLRKEVFKPDGELAKSLNAGNKIFMDQGDKWFDFLRKNMLKGAAVAAIGAGMYYTAATGVPMIMRMIERMLTQPKLIIASSKQSIREKIEALFKPGLPLTPMVFAPKLETRLNTIVKVTASINKAIANGKTNVKYRNLMLYGPPGTGKTMFATELAKRSGLEYAFMSGSSFAKFKGGEGIEALDELFAWANKSKGLMIFIDEAETFLSKRENMDTQSQAYLLLNNFLNYTGTRSNKFMLVFATNHKDALDSAMYRRIDDLVEMPLPGHAERIRVLDLYKHKILMDVKQNGQPFVDSVKSVLNNKKISSIADKTKGLSGGDLEGVMNAIKTDTDIADPSIVTEDLVDTVVQQAVDKHTAFTHGKHLGMIED